MVVILPPGEKLSEGNFYFDMGRAKYFYVERDQEGKLHLDYFGRIGIPADNKKEIDAQIVDPKHILLDLALDKMFVESRLEKSTQTPTIVDLTIDIPPVNHGPLGPHPYKKDGDPPHPNIKY